MKRDFIINWFVEHGTFSKEELERDFTINYFEKGIIDSFAFLKLISTCEEQFDITFNDDDFSNDEIFTISGLIALLEEK